MVPDSLNNRLRVRVETPTAWAASLALILSVRCLWTGKLLMILRDFKKCVGMTADEVYAAMEDMKNCGGRLSAQNRQLLKSMILYWEHQYQLLQGFEKDRQKL